MDPGRSIKVYCNCVVKFGIIEQLKPCKWEFDGDL